ncbi:MAG: CDP-alcohol phosphatidyltransferase family protein [Gammaproteobacteria bacterium]|nr:MAG: CDP-alcohol phosphatidyltransferase family protein [Gammaproteobacteria bacterium]
MAYPKHDIYNLPNLVSFIRLLLAPLLLLLAFAQEIWWFIAILIFSEFTDVLDGYLARRLNQITPLGARLDSWGDFFIYSTLAVSAWLLWPGIVKREIIWVAIIIASFTLPVLIGLVKFGNVTSYHTWSVKIAVAVTVISYILLFTEILDWPFRLAAIVCVYAAIEQVLITLVMKQQHVDVKTYWHALKYTHHNQASLGN